MSSKSPRKTIGTTTFEALRDHYGWCASGAIWSPAGATPKSGIADLTQFEADVLQRTLRISHGDVFIVGINTSTVNTMIQAIQQYRENDQITGVVLPERNGVSSEQVHMHCQKKLIC